MKKPMSIQQPSGLRYSFSKEWRPDPDSRRRISTGEFSTREEADAAAAESLFLMGYKTPRWWQWWRWGETLPPNEVLAILKELNA